MQTTRRDFMAAGLSVAGMLACIGCEQPTTESKASESPAGQPSKEDGSVNHETVKVKVFNSKGEFVGPIDEPKIIKTDAQWQAQLTKKQYEIARAKGTEFPGCGTLLDNHLQGVYSCVCCGLPLFSSDSKFNSGTGWPSFFKPISQENVAEHTDRDGSRTEILCVRCDCHLGHVFDDGPRPTGMRFCVNSESLKFTPSDKLATLADPAAKS